MLSMAAASLFLPFLPLLAGQILLNNFISDIPAIGIADDSVDPELVERPRRWNVQFHRALHGRIRLRQLYLRFPDVWRVAHDLPCGASAVPHGLVRRVSPH
jgi:hypothetical protein